VPVHSPSATTIQQPISTVGNASGLHRLSVNRSRPEIPPPPRSNFGKTKLRGPLESTKLPEKGRKTKLSEAENEGKSKKEILKSRETKLSEADKPIRGKKSAGRIYPDSYQIVKCNPRAVFSWMRGLRFPFFRLRPGRPRIGTGRTCRASRSPRCRVIIPAPFASLKWSKHGTLRGAPTSQKAGSA
jgi:hypothetical protein